MEQKKSIVDEAQHNLMTKLNLAPFLSFVRIDRRKNKSLMGFVMSLIDQSTDPSKTESSSSLIEKKD
ncbi:CLUMA_CG010144, isoform A [Clunio marinus]|uniref:CLUMA_CG010144, isoform A n=1 Tax=Clunio marinus TaxID=568069 RepID=A0A1J1I8J2_9DIPT|nr:CLUMA_CG010144, isoform A [Clunio marinus]